LRLKRSYENLTAKSRPTDNNQKRKHMAAKQISAKTGVYTLLA